MNTTQHTDGPEYTPGPWNYMYGKTLLHIESDISCKDGAGIPVCSVPKSREGNARFIMAAVNAFISAGEKLGINPVILAERLEKGGIAEIVDVLKSGKSIPYEGYDQYGKRVSGVRFISDKVKTAKALSLVRGEPRNAPADGR